MPTPTQIYVKIIFASTSKFIRLFSSLSLFLFTLNDARDQGNTHTHKKKSHGIQFTFELPANTENRKQNKWNELNEKSAEKKVISK